MKPSNSIPKVALATVGRCAKGVRPSLGGPLPPSVPNSLRCMGPGAQRTLIHRLALVAGAVVALCSAASAQVVDYSRDRAGNVIGIRIGDQASLAPRAQLQLPFGHVGATVSVSGHRLSNTQQATFGPAIAAPRSVADREVSFVVPAGARSGPVVLSVDGASVSTSETFYLLPATIPADQIAGVNQSDRANLVGGQWTLSPLPLGHAGLLNLQMDSLFQSAPAPIDYKLIGPAGTVLASGTLPPVGASLALPALSPDEHHVLALKSTGWSRLAWSYVADPQLIKDGDFLTMSIAAFGSSSRFGFQAEPGDHFSLGFSHIGIVPSNRIIVFDLHGPDGSFLKRARCGRTSLAGQCNIRIRGALQGGTYTLLGYGENGSVSAFGARVWLSSEDFASFAIDALNDYRLDRPGKMGTITFEAQAGDRLSWSWQDLTKLVGDGSFQYTIRNPDGSCLHAGCTVLESPWRSQFELPAITQTGTHSVEVNIRDNGRWSAALAVPITLSRDRQLGELTVDGSGLQIADSVYGRRSWAEFDGVAGETLSVGATAVTTSPGRKNLNFEVYRPDGSLWRTAVCGSSSAHDQCDAALWDLPQSGTYRLRVRPTDTAANSFNSTVWLTRQVEVNLTLDETRSLNLGRPAALGRGYVELLPGQARRLLATNVVVPVNHYFRYVVVKPDGTCLTAGCPLVTVSATTPTVLPAVTAAGTYQLYFDIVNSGSVSTSGSVDLRLENVQ